MLLRSTLRDCVRYCAQLSTDSCRHNMCLNSHTVAHEFVEWCTKKYATKIVHNRVCINHFINCAQKRTQLCTFFEIVHNCDNCARNYTHCVQLGLMYKVFVHNLRTVKTLKRKCFVLHRILSISNTKQLFVSYIGFTN